MGNWLGFPDEDPQPGDNGSPNRIVNNGNIRPAIESMAVHVKDVLPQVPMDVIRKDLTVTTNVDETITRLLDGTVTYTPERKPAPSATTSPAARPMQTATAAISSSPPFSAPTHPPLITAAKSFGKNADERHKSFEERKQRLIEEAKRRYLEKQALLNQASGSS